MKRLCLGMGVAGLLGVVLAVSGQNTPQSSAPPGGLLVQRAGRNPWTHLNLNNNPSDFQFAIVSDRTGKHRAGIFSQAVERLNLMQPEFVLCVGDLIEGGGKDPKVLTEQWKEFDSYVNRLQMPFFYLPGNHDAGNKTSDATWTERFGRRYYHFLYKNVLFLCLNTEDPPGTTHMDKAQIAYVQKTLAANHGVHWTVVLMHKPIWNGKQVQDSGWLEVEKSLADRPYTVFVGHVHSYQKFVRNGRNYYQLATTGGGSKLRGVQQGEFDHIVWVTMKKTGPVLANILVDSILPEDLMPPRTDEPGVAKRGKPAQPVRGKVFFQGSPVPQAYVVFHGDSGDRKGVRADAIVEADGSFALSTYTAYDGAPTGDYRVSVVWRKPFYREDGSPGPDLLPKHYGNPDTSGLRATVKQGDNDVILELTR